MKTYTMILQYILPYCTIAINYHYHTCKTWLGAGYHALSSSPGYRGDRSGIGGVRPSVAPWPRETRGDPPFSLSCGPTTVRFFFLFTPPLYGYAVVMVCFSSFTFRIE